MAIRFEERYRLSAIFAVALTQIVIAVRAEKTKSRARLVEMTYVVDAFNDIQRYKGKKLLCAIEDV